MRQKTLIFLTGTVPFIAGFFLIKTGFSLLVGSSQEMEMLGEMSYPLLTFFKTLFGSLQTSLLLLIVLACSIGYVKGKFVISKSTLRNVQRLQTMPQPIKLIQLYPVSYYCLIAGMMSLGMLMNITGIPKDVRGLIDAAIGFALIEGSLVAFRTTWQKQPA